MKHKFAQAGLALILLPSFAFAAGGGKEGDGVPAPVRLLTVCKDKKTNPTVEFSEDITNPFGSGLKPQTVYQLKLADSTPSQEWGVDRPEFKPGFLHRDGKATFPLAALGTVNLGTDEAGSTALRQALSDVLRDYNRFPKDTEIYTTASFTEVNFKTANPVWPALRFLAVRNSGSMEVTISGEDGAVVYQGEPWKHQSFFRGVLTCEETVE